LSKNLYGTNMEKTTKVFVYGSLKKGFGNHSFLLGELFLRTTRTKLYDYTMISLDSFPAVFTGGKHSIEGELYEVSFPTLKMLDVLEGNGELYERTLIELVSGEKAWMYCFSDRFELPSDYVESSPRVKITDNVATWLQSF